MQMTYEQAMRPGMLLAFATRRGSGYMMRSEKRDGSYGGNRRRPPKRKPAGFFYIFLTLLVSILLWPLGMVMLWRRKVRLQAGTKLLISLLTLCLSVFLIVFALTVPVDNPEFTAFQDKANDWLDQAAADVSVAGDAAIKKTTETWQVMTDFAEAERDYAALQAADALDKGVELAGQARTAIEGLLHRDGAPTEAPDQTEAPQTEAPGTEAPAKSATDAPEGEASDAPEDEASTAPTDENGIDIALPDETPEAKDATPLGEGQLHANGEFEPGEVASNTVAGEPVEEATESPTWEFVKETEAAEEATEAPTEEPAEATEAPAEGPADGSAEEPAAVAATEAATEEPTEAPTEEPTEEPTEAPTEEPEETPDPNAPYHLKSAAKATVYFYPGTGSKGFHRTPTVHDMDGAPAHTLAEAFEAGKKPCNSCGMPEESILDVEHIAWVDEANRIHTTDECESFSGDWRLMSLKEALDAGREPCPDCGADIYAEEIYPTPTPTPEPTPSPTPEVVTPETPLKSAGDFTVYFFDAGKGYHLTPNCVGMSNAPAHTLAEAVAAGKSACSNCKPPVADVIDKAMLWQDGKGLCHTSDECAAFSGAVTLVERDAALEEGLEACPDCGAADYLVPGTVLAEK